MLPAIHSYVDELFFQQTKKFGLLLLNVLCFHFCKYLVSIGPVHLLFPVLICI